MIVAESLQWKIGHMDDLEERLALHTSTILAALTRVRYELRLIVCGLLLLVIAFIAHAVLFAMR